MAFAVGERRFLPSSSIQSPTRQPIPCCDFGVALTLVGIAPDTFTVDRHHNVYAAIDGGSSPEQPSRTIARSLAVTHVCSEYAEIWYAEGKDVHQHIFSLLDVLGHTNVEGYSICRRPGVVAPCTGVSQVAWRKENRHEAPVHTFFGPYPDIGIRRRL